MDPIRFDSWTRGVARRIQRRGLIAGMTGGILSSLVVNRRAAAQQGLLEPGAECFTTEQCSQFGGPQVCADNGITQDGALNCCRIQAGACAIDSHCCGSLNCVNTFCVGDDQTEASGTGALGSPCTATSECAAVTNGRVICGENYVAEDGPLNCCLEEGSTCTASNDCCGTFNCEGGFCGSGEGGDLAPGEYCVNSTQCSQALGPARCDTNSVSASPICCLLEASSCSGDEECCGDYVCASNGIAGDGGSNCCGYSGVSCASDASCCADLFCLNGSCQPL